MRVGRARKRLDESSERPKRTAGVPSLPLRSGLVHKKATRVTNVKSKSEILAYLCSSPGKWTRASFSFGFLGMAMGRSLLGPMVSYVDISQSWALNFSLKLILIPPLAYAGAQYVANRPRLSTASRVYEIFLLILACLFFTVRLTGPVAYVFSDHAPAGTLDSTYLAYVQAWDSHALWSHPRHLFDNNIFYPAKNALALSENLLGNLPIFTPFYALTHNPILSSNVVLLATFFLSAVTMYLLVRSLTGNPWAAAIAGFVYSFAPARIFQMERVHVISMQWVPLIILFLYRFLRDRRLGSLAGFIGFLLLQVLCSLHGGCFAVLITAAYLLSFCLIRPALIKWRALAGLVAACLVIGLALLPVARPYFRLEKEGTLLTFRAPVQVSATPSSYLNGGRSHFYGNSLNRFRSREWDHEKKLFLGFLPLALSLVAVSWYLFRKVRHWFQSGQKPPEDLKITTQREEGARGVLILGSIFTVASAFVLSLGPYLKIGDTPTSIPLPYLWLSRWVPGFSVLRNPSRFGFAVLFGVAVLAGLGLTNLSGLLARWRRFQQPGLSAALAAALMFLMYWEFNRTPVPIFPVMTPGNMASEYRWLARQAPGSVTLELPTTAWQSPAPPEILREESYVYASTYHWQPIINGFSGHIPQVSYQTSSQAAKFPAPEAVTALGKLGLRFVILHSDKLSPTEKAVWQNLPEESGLQEVARFDNAIIYQVRKLVATQSLKAGRYREIMP